MNTPQVLDLVWCRFPTREHPGHPGPKERPVLILGLSQDGSLVAAAYGTSQAHQPIKASEIQEVMAARGCRPMVAPTAWEKLK